MPHKRHQCFVEEHRSGTSRRMDRFSLGFVASSRDLVLQTVAQEIKKRCSGVNPFISLDFSLLSTIHHRLHLHLLSHQCFLPK
jgi:hypothetical protein